MRVKNQKPSLLIFSLFVRFFFFDFFLQAERIMEALELYKGETRKMEEHRYACESAGKEVES